MPAPTPKIEFAEQDLIEQAAPLGREFLKRVLDMDWDDCLVTDESALSDFSLCGIPRDQLPEGPDLKQCYAIWDAWVLQKVKDEFGVELPRTGLLLLTVFDLIEAHRRQSVH